MNKKRSSKFYLIAAIVWTVIAFFALYVLFFATEGANMFTKLCGLVLISMCVCGQWLRYRKMK